LTNALRPFAHALTAALLLTTLGASSALAEWGPGQTRPGAPAAALDQARPSTQQPPKASPSAQVADLTAQRAIRTATHHLEELPQPRVAAATALQPKPLPKAKPKPKSKHKPKPKSKHKPKPRIAPRRSPGRVAAGHYIRSLRGNRQDRARMVALGRWDARHNLGGRQYVVLLDIGGQVRGGVHLSTTRRFISYRALVAAMNAYVDGYHSRQHRNAPVKIALGTNNDLLTSVATGRAWARQVVNPVRRHAARYKQLVIVGADDIEPGFGAGAHATRNWMLGYLSATTAPMVFNGSADGCSPTRAMSRCNNGWRASELAWLAGGVAPNRITVLPQIYNRTMAAQWEQISRTALAHWHRPLKFEGVLTENRACGRDPSCPTMPSAAAWRALWAVLHHRRATTPASLPSQTDLDVR
jgi:hypothetical protein